MPQVTSRVLFINPPKPDGKGANIKTEHGSIYCEPSALTQYQRGMVYTFDYNEKQGTRGPIKILARQPVQAGLPIAVGGGPAGSARSPRPYSAAPAGKPQAMNDRMIFITGVVGRSMGSGKFEANDITTLAMMAANAYEALENMQTMEEPAPPVAPSPPAPVGARTVQTGYGSYSRDVGPRDDVPFVGDDMNDDVPF